MMTIDSSNTADVPPIPRKGDSVSVTFQQFTWQGTVKEVCWEYSIPATKVRVIADFSRC